MKSQDEDGVENSEQYELAKVLLAYITSDITGVNDEIHYTDEFLDEQMYRDTFEMIFRCMGQGQHFYIGTAFPYDDRQTIRRIGKCISAITNFGKC